MNIHAVNQLPTCCAAACLYQAGENQGVGGLSRPGGPGHPLQRGPGEPATGQESRGDEEVLHRAQDAEVN